MSLFSFKCFAILSSYVIILLVFMSLVNIVFTFNKRLKSSDTPIVTAKGPLFASVTEATVYNKTIKFIKDNTTDKDVVLVLPESPFLNFLTDRPTNPLYYHLIANHISALGEDNIVKGLTLAPPNYIIIQSISLKLYGSGFLGIDYGLKITKFITENYDFLEKIHSQSFVTKNFN